MFFVPLNKFGIQFCPYASLGANTIGCIKRSCLSFLWLGVHSPEDFCFFSLGKVRLHPLANTIGRVKRSCLSLFMARGDEYGFLKLTYLLINIYVNFGNVSNKKGG